MNRFGVGIAAVLILHLAAAGQVPASTLYATGNAGTELLAVDLSAQSVRVVGPTNYPQSFALAFDPDGTAYTITNLFSATTAQLATLNLNTGAATLVGSPLGAGNLQMMGLTVSPQGHIYGAGLPATTIYAIDKATGAPTAVGSSTTLGLIMSFAYSPEGKLYAASCCATPNMLYTVNLTNGTTNPVAPLSLSAGGGLSSVMGLAIDGQGVMYASTFVGCPPCSSIYTVDPATGVATKLFNTGIARVHNLAFSPGTPAQQLAALAARVSGAALPYGIGNSLQVKLSAADAAISRANLPAACGVMGAFLNEVAARENQTATSAEQVTFAQLTFAGVRLRTALGCR